MVRGQSSSLLPTASLSARTLRQRISANRPLTNYDGTNFSTVQNDGVLSLVVGYEFDLAGRVQRTVEGVQASAEQSAADLENTRLLLGADLATAYFNLRAVDIEIDVIDETNTVLRFNKLIRRLKAAGSRSAWSYSGTIRSTMHRARRSSARTP